MTNATLTEGCSSMVKVLQDWQRDLLGENIKVFYQAMKKHKMAKYSDADVGRDVLAYVTRAMCNYDPTRSKISTFIYKYVDFGLREGRREFRAELECRPFAVSSYGYGERDLQLVDPLSLKDMEKEPYRIEELFQALKSLPPNYKEALTLHYYKGKSYSEGGTLMGVSKQRFGQLVKSGLNKLKSLMP